jgi:hypothetical protein
MRTENHLVAVDVTLVTEMLKSPQFHFGEWVNIIGYRTGKRAFAFSPSGGTLPASTRIPLVSQGDIVTIQAILSWSAGSIEREAYEDALQARRTMDEAVLQMHAPGYKTV